MTDNYIKIRGARVNNLKNIDIDIPKNKLVVITGLSGSGKSSLAFDTIYAEGQRRYVESLSSYARQFLGVMNKPDVEKIEGISPAISIDQRKGAHNPRSTVGTITEIYDYLRLLFARIGKPHCSKCKKPITRTTIDQIVKQVLSLPKDQPSGEVGVGRRPVEIVILGPVIRGKKGEHYGILGEIKRAGFVRVRFDGIIYRLEEILERPIDKNKKHNIEVVIDRLLLDKDLDKSRLIDSIRTALKFGKGIVIVNKSSSHQVAKSSRKKLNHLITQSLSDLIFSEHFACEGCGVSLPELEPRFFSFNNPLGACPGCTGLGEKLEIDPELIIPNKNLTIAEGAIWPWMRVSHKTGGQSSFWNKLSEIAKKYDFSLDEPIKELSQKNIDVILYGNDFFEGIIPNLEKKYHETDSDWTRQEIEQYMIQKQCPQCLLLFFA